MATAETTIKVTADTAQAERALGNLHNRLLDIGKVVIAGALVNQFYKIAESIDALNKASIKFGIDPAQFDALAKSAELAGISFDELTAGLQKLSINIGDALLKNTGPAAVALDMLGIKATEIANLSADQQLIKIKDALVGIENPALRSAIAMDILGKQGVKLLKAADEADRLRKRFDEMGLSLSKVDTQGVENALDKLTEIKQIMEGAVAKAVAAIAPYVEVAANAVIKFAETFGGPLVAAISAAARGLTVFFAILLAAKVAGAIQAIVMGFVGMVTAIRAAGTAAAAFNLIVGANPIVRIATVVGTIAALFGGPLINSAMEFLGINDAVNKVLGETTAQVKEREKASKGDAEAAVLALNLAKLRKDLEENIVPALQEQVRLSSIRVTQDEAAYETEKQIGELAKKYSLSAEQARQAVGGRIGLLQQEIAISDRLLKNKELIKSLDEGTKIKKGLVDQDVLNIEKALNQAKIDEAKASDSELKKIASGQVRDLQKQYTTAIDFQIMAASAEMSITRDKVAQINRVESAITNARKIGYGEDHAAMISLQNAKLVAEQDYQNTILQLTANRIQAQLALEGSLSTRSIADSDKLILQKIGEQDRLKAAAASRVEFEKKSDTEKYAFGIEQGAQMFSALGAQNKKAFEAAKAFNIANAIMNTYMAATKALASYPFPFSLIASGAAIAMGMAQVAQIRSQSYSGRALGGPVMGGQSYMVGENGPEMFTPSTTGSITRNGDLGAGGANNINFTIVANDAQGFDDLLIQRKGMIKQFISDAMTENGQRSRM